MGYFRGLNMKIQKGEVPSMANKKNEVSTMEYFIDKRGGERRHLSIVVKDRDKTIETLSSLLGLGPWTTFDATFLKGVEPSKTGEYATLIVGEPHHEKSAFVSLKKLGLGNLWLEIIQPVEEECPPDRFIKTRGEGLHHLSIIASDWDKLVAKMEKHGCKMLFRAIVPNGKRTCYFEIIPSGLILEIAE
jgi:catechol 2,3-dioxygenase-like lactoylglutathione lyase family enzyme